jgi:WASH complex subunit CCDC53
MSDIPLFNSHIDKNKMPAIHKKRMLAFINDFILTTANFLNNFTSTCESKLIQLDSKMQNLENSLLILEAKLASVPSNEPVQPVQTKEIPPENIPSETPKQEEKPEVPADKSTEIPVDSLEEKPPEVEETSSKNLIKVSEDSRYKKYFKMVQFGVSAAAIKQKMACEDVDPDLLDNPNLMIERLPELHENIEEFV